MLVDETTQQSSRGVFRLNWWRIDINFHIIPPPISIEPGDGAIDPVEGKGSKKICDLKKTSSF